MLPRQRSAPRSRQPGGVPLGTTASSPPAHSAFTSARADDGVFWQAAPDLSGGTRRVQAVHSDTSANSCVWSRRCWRNRDRARLYVVDGDRSGTGAPVGVCQTTSACRMVEGWTFCGTYFARWPDPATGETGRQRGKVVSAFDISRALALGADWLAISAVGSCLRWVAFRRRRCHTISAPLVATQDPRRQRALDVDDKSRRGRRGFHRNTLMALGERRCRRSLESPAIFPPAILMMRAKAITHGAGGSGLGYLPEGYLLDDQSPDYNGNKNPLGTGTGRAALMPFD